MDVTTPVGARPPREAEPAEGSRAWWDARYESGNHPWDTGLVPPEVQALVRSLGACNGWALDLGCGTGTNAIYLARSGFRALGVDLALTALLRGRRAVRETGADVLLLASDVSDLACVKLQAGLALDIGCYHSLPLPARDRYVSSLAAHMLPNAPFLLYGFDRPAAEEEQSGIAPVDIARFAPFFSLRWAQHGYDRDRPSSWYLLRRSNRGGDVFA
jgi:SAM-dependent methyltransferase